MRRRVPFLLRKIFISSYSSFFSLFRSFVSFSSCFDVAEFELCSMGPGPGPGGRGRRVAGGACAGVLFFLGII